MSRSRDPHRGCEEARCPADPPHTGRPTTACCRGLGREGQYPEITKYPHRHSHHRVEAALATPDCFDGARFAQRATTPALFGADLTTPACPTSTVYAALNHCASQDRTATLRPFAGHDSGCGSNPPTRLARRGLSPEL